MALGHSGAEVATFVIKVLMTLTDVFLGWRKVAACVYLALSLLLAWQYLRWVSSAGRLRGGCYRGGCTSARSARGGDMGSWHARASDLGY